MAKKPSQQEAPELFAQVASKHPAVIAPPQPPLRAGVNTTPTTAAAELVAKLQWFIHVG